MKELHVIQRIDEARILLNPIRVAMLEMLQSPLTCLDIARKLKITQQRVNNNIREMQRAGLVRLVENRTKRNFIEGVYQTVSKAFWFSPQLLRSNEADLRKVREQLSLHNLLLMSERLQHDVGQLLDAQGRDEVPSIGVTADIVLRSEEERQAFTKDFLTALHSVLEKYQGSSSPEQRYTAMIICYPEVEELKGSSEVN